MNEVFPGQSMDDPLVSALNEVGVELMRATRKFGPFRTAHEGYAVILEEMDELWDDVKGNNPHNARKEAVQIAAMAVRYMIDLKSP